MVELGVGEGVKFFDVDYIVVGVEVKSVKEIFSLDIVLKVRSGFSLGSIYKYLDMWLIECFCLIYKYKM